MTTCPSRPQELRAEAPSEPALRVAFFSDAFAERNGTGAYYHDLLAQLSVRVDEVQIFQPASDGPRPVLSIPMPGDAGQRLVAPSLRQVRASCDALMPTVIVVVTPGLYGLLGVWEARRRKIPLVAGFHTDFEQLARMYWNPLARFFVNLVVGTANRIICRSSASVLINNAGLRDDVRRLGAVEVDVIGTPLDTAFLTHAPVPIEPRLKRVCFAGRLAPEKNVAQVLAAARAQPDIEFLIAGDGPLRESLEQEAQDCPNVRFLGWQSRTELLGLFDDVSLLLLPSAFETFGSVALEAMARGRPALVTRSAGIHAWPALRAGLFTLETPEDLPQVLDGLRELSAADWERRSLAARSVAQALNARTLDHWAELLRHHSQAVRPPAIGRDSEHE